MTAEAASREPFALDAALVDALRRRIESARLRWRAETAPRVRERHRRASTRRARPVRRGVRRRAGPTTASSASSSPTATASRSRRWARRRRSRRSGPGRFARGRGACARPRPARVRRRSGGRPDSSAERSGRCSCGGFAFAPDGGADARVGLARPGAARPARVSLARAPRRGAADAATRRRRRPTTAPTSLLERLDARLRGAGARRRCRCSIPTPSSRPRVAGAAPPAHYEARGRAGGRADPRRRAREGRAGARGARARSARPLDPAPVFDALRAASPPASATASGTPELAFVGASPELLVRREGARAQTVALAGTTRRSADPAVDDHLGEQLLHERQGPRGAGDRRPPDRAHARAREPLGRGGRRAGAGEGAERPAPGDADPRAAREPLPRSSWRGCCTRRRRSAASRARRAEPLIPALEGLDRGWYAGPIGWTDLAEDGEFCVALRCALLRGAHRPPLRRLRDRARLGAGRGAGRDRDQAPGASAAVRLAGLAVPVDVRAAAARERPHRAGAAEGSGDNLPDGRGALDVESAARCHFELERKRPARPVDVGRVPERPGIAEVGRQATRARRRGVQPATTQSPQPTSADAAKIAAMPSRPPRSAQP